MTTLALSDAIEFIWLEADLLDNHDYKTWLGLWTETGHYIIPIERGVTDHAAALNVAYDDNTMREARVARLMSGFSMSASPSARTVRTVSRFRVLEQGADFMTVRAAQQIVEYKYERTRILAADVTYRIVQTEAGLKLDEKIIQLINSDGALHGIGYLF